MSVTRAVLISVAAHVVVGGAIAARALAIGVVAPAAREPQPPARGTTEVDDVLEVAILPPETAAAEAGGAPAASPPSAAADVAVALAASAPSAAANVAVALPAASVANAAANAAKVGSRSTGAVDPAIANGLLLPTGVAALSTTGGGVSGETAAGGGAGGSSYFAMRGPDLSLPADIAERAIATARPAPAGPDESRIVRRGRNVYIPDLQVPATVNEDGTVKFHDKPAADIHWRIHLPSSKDLGDALATWYADPYAQTRARPWQELNKVDQAVEGDGAGWDSGGAVGDGQSVASMNQAGYARTGQPQVPIVGGALDLTSWAMRKFHVGDPYASRKRKLLAETFDARVAIRTENEEARLARSIALMTRNVARVWGAADLTLAAKHAALFGLWDECAEGDAATSHEAAAGARARAIVIGFIRAHAAPGTADAFTPDEIAHLDAGRSSKQHFVPYAP